MRVGNLIVWKKAYEFTLKIYKITVLFPVEEKYALTSQLRRAALSVPANIAEGKGRGTQREFVRFLHIARGSLEECSVYIMLAKDLTYIDEKCYVELNKYIVEIGKMLNGLIQSQSDSLLREEELRYE